MRRGVNQGLERTVARGKKRPLSWPFAHYRWSDCDHESCADDVRNVEVVGSSPITSTTALTSGVRQSTSSAAVSYRSVGRRRVTARDHRRPWRAIQDGTRMARSGRTGPYVWHGDGGPGGRSGSSCYRLRTRVLDVEERDRCRAASRRAGRRSGGSLTSVGQPQGPLPGTRRTGQRHDAVIRSGSVACNRWLYFGGPMSPSHA